MRLTAIREDGSIVINGTGYVGFDLSFLDPNIHAIQWYETEGEVEIKDARGRMIENRKIESLDEYQQLVSLWEAVDKNVRSQTIQELDLLINLAETKQTQPQ